MTEAVYGILINLIVYSACLNFYGRIKGEKLDNGKFYLVIALSGLYRFLLPASVETAIQIVISFIVVGGLLMLLEKKVSWVLLLTSFLMSYTLRILAMLSSVLLSVFIFTVLGNDLQRSRMGENFMLILTITITIAVLSAVISLDEKKKINLFMNAKHLEAKLVRNIVFVIGFLVVVLHTFIFTDFGFNLTSTLAFVFWGASTLLILAIISLTIFLIWHLNVEKKKQLRLEQQYKQLESENEAIELQFLELKTVHNDLYQEYGVVKSNHHAYKYIVPTLMNMQQDFIGELDKFADYSHAEKLKRIRDYADQIRLLSFQINNDLAIDHVDEALNRLKIPENWQALRGVFQKIMQVALTKDIYLSVYNHDEFLQNLDVPQSIYIRLLSNIVDNAIKESCKIDVAKRGEVKITLIEEDGYSGFEVRDAAAEFEISVLQKLGQRKNSTNGTGDGYAEIFNDLREVGASFMIREMKLHDNTSIKTISVIFDGHSMRLIDSPYRFYVLMDELAGTELEVMDIHVPRF